MKFYTLFILLFFTGIYSYGEENPKIDSLKNLSVNNSDPEIYNRLAYEYFKSNMDSCFKYANLALDLADDQNDNENLATAHKRLALYYWGKDERDPGIKHFKLAAEKYNEANNSRQEAAVYEELAKIYRKKSVYDSALRANRHAANLRFSINDSTDAARSLYSIGSTFYSLTNYDSALFYLYKSLALKEKLGMDASSINDHTVIGLIFFHLFETDKSMEHQLKALELSRQNNDKNIVHVLNNLGLVYLDKKQYQDAIEQFEEVVRRLKETGTVNNLLGGALDNIGLCYIELENYEKAIQYQLEGLKIRKEINYKWGIANSSKNIGKCYVKLKDAKNALKHLNEGLPIAKEIGSLNVIAGFYRYLAQAYELDNNYRLAYNAHTEYLLYFDTLNEIKGGELMAETRTKYETEKKEQQLEILSQENEIKDLKLSQSTNLNIGLGILALLIIGFAVLLVRYFRTIQKHKNSLMEQKLLRSQMNPHFIFNSLIAIQSFIYDKNAITAGNYLSKFADLIRLILENSRQEFVTFEKEIKTLELYLELQALRFDQKFSYKIDVDQAIEMKGLKIPPMLAQPFLENAIEHGIQHKKEKGNININFKMKEDEILFVVEDDGVGRVNADMINKNKENYHESLATSITKERLGNFSKSLNKKFSINITDIFGKQEEIAGTKVTFSLPYVLA